MHLRHRITAGAGAALLLTGGALLAGAAPASALPKQCDRLYNIADTHWLYAEASYAVGDYAAYDHWMNVYDLDLANIIASGC